MTSIKFSHVISCSSEDPSFPARNLLQESSFLKWKCKSHEPEISVILQMDTSTKIHNIDIGNENSAFIEVLVGRSASPDTFHTLLGASAFMSPNDSKIKSKGNQVRMFKYDHLTKPFVDESWDRVKIVCCQPFNRTIQYGLSFIKLTPPESKSESKNSLGRFLLKENEEPEIKIGSIFAKFKNKQATIPTGAGAIRKAAQDILNNSYDKPSTSTASPSEKQNDFTKHISPQMPKIKERKNSLENVKTPKVNDRLGKTKKQSPMAQMDLNKKNDSPQTSKGTKGVKEQALPAMKKKLKNNQGRFFYQLLEDVVFVISGIQNPERANLRSKALEMGAKYKADWDNQCTHLICAFANTPKFNQVKGKGKIVKKQWIEECHSKRKKIPWRRFALDNSDRTKPESEDEILEKISEDESEGDIDLNINEPTKNGSPNEIKNDDENEINSYELDTEDELMVETEDTSVPELTDLFSNITFYLNKLDSNQTKDLKRLIIAFKGKLTDDIDSATYVVSSHNVEEKHPNAILSDWIWDCSIDKKLHPITKYKI